MKGYITEQELSNSLKVSKYSEPIISSKPIIHLDNKLSGKAKLEIEGCTMSNIIYNGNFSNGTDGWSSNNGSISVSKNKLIATLGGTDSSATIQQIASNIRKVGVAYWGRATVRVTNSECSSIRIVVAGGGTYDIVNPEPNKWYTIYTKFTATANSNTIIAIQPYYPDATTANGKVMEVKEVIAIDLDTHPQLANLTADEINDRILNYIKGTQSVEGLRLKNVGKNLIPNMEMCVGNIILEDGKVKVDSNSVTRRTVIIPIKHNTTYAVNIDSSKYKWSYDTVDGNSELIYNEGWNKLTTLTTPNNSNIKYLFFSIAKDNDSNFSPTDFPLSIQLEEGIVATEYEPYKENSIMLPPIHSLPSGVKDVIREGKNGLEKVKRIEKVVLDDSLDWNLYHNDVEYKALITTQVFLNKIDGYTNAQYIGIKYNGEMLISSNGHSSTNSILVLNSTGEGSDNGKILLTISNTDTGWGDSYTPTVDEIKAYFMGWTMTTNLNTMYQGVGTKYWAKTYCGRGTKYVSSDGLELVLGSGVETCPTIMNDMGYTPYKLYYQLANEEVIDLKTPSPIVEENGTMYIENWVKYVLREEDIADIFRNNVCFDYVRTKTIFIDNEPWSSDIIDSTIVAGKQQTTYPPNYDNVSMIGKFVSHNGLGVSTIDFQFEKGITLAQAKKRLVGTVIYYKQALEYSIVPKTTITLAENRVSQIEGNVESIKLLNEISQENKDLLETHGIRLDNVQGIEESGSNANGDYIKFADGTLVSYSGLLEVNNYTGVTPGTTYTINWTFPVKFKTGNRPIVLGNVGFVNSQHDSKALVTTLSYDWFKGILFVTPTVTNSMRLKGIAIGRWK